MPIYEYQCNGCQRRTSVFTRSVTAAVSARCEHCGSGDLSRLMSRIAVLRSESDGGPDFSSSLAGVDENDPRSIARWVRKMSNEMGEPLDSQMAADLERMESGESLDDFEGGDASGDDDFGF
jgi:putative FmdB family regulatory protein